MGLFTNLKSIFVNNQNVQTEDCGLYLVAVKTNLKQAGDFLNNFLLDLRGFVPARRHEQLYAESVYGRVSLIRAWLQKSVAFLDDKLNNSINTASSVKSTNYLSSIIGDWLKVLKGEEVSNVDIPDKAEKNVVVYYRLDSSAGNMQEKIPDDVLGILRAEMWSDKRVSRGFPVPRNKELLYNHLENAYAKIKEAKMQLENYNLQSGGMVIQKT